MADKHGRGTFTTHTHIHTMYDYAQTSLYLLPFYLLATSSFARLLSIDKVHFHETSQCIA